MWRIGSWVRGIPTDWDEAFCWQRLRASLFIIIRVQYHFSRGYFHLEEIRVLYGYICHNFLLARAVQALCVRNLACRYYVFAAKRSADRAGSADASPA